MYFEQREDVLCSQLLISPLGGRVLSIPFYLWLQDTREVVDQCVSRKTARMPGGATIHDYEQM